MKPRRLHSATISSRVGPSAEGSLTRGTVPHGAYDAAPMPIYEYRCDNGHTFEAFQSMADDPLEECEVCGAPARRLLSAPAVHFKGSGFYTTDYARKGKAKAGGGDSGGGGES